MVSDRDPRYQLLDSNGTVVGSLYEKSNGKLALQDGNTDTEVVFDGDTIGSGGESLDIDSLASGIKVLDLIDSASGNTVYNSSSEQLGDGNQNADLNDVVLNDITDGTSANTVYDSSSETLGDGNQDVNVNSVSTNSLIIGGTLYEEDDNSPLTPQSAFNHTYTVSGDYDEIIIIPESNNQGFDQFRINGQTSSDYRELDNSDTVTTGNTEITAGISTRYMKSIRIGVVNSLDRIGFNFEYVRASSGLTSTGEYRGSGSSSINSVQLIDSGGTNRAANARVFGRVMDI